MPDPHDVANKDNLLGTAQAASLLHLSQSEVARLCTAGKLAGAFKRHGRWHIPKSAIQPSQGPLARNLRRLWANAVGVWTHMKAALLLALALLGIASFLANLPAAQRHLREWDPLHNAFSHEADGETLIVIANFYHSDNLVDTEAHDRIRCAIEDARDQLGLAQPRVEVHPSHIKAPDRAAAERLGKAYGATMVIWGGDDGLQLAVNFLNLRGPTFGPTLMSATGTGYIADPKAYTEFVTSDLPGQLTYFSFYAIGNAHMPDADPTLAIQCLETAVDSLAPDSIPRGLADALYNLGALYQAPPLYDAAKALVYYNRSLQIQPHSAWTCSNAGAAHSYLGENQQAIELLDQALTAATHDGDRAAQAAALTNLGAAYQRLADYSHAKASLDQALTICRQIGDRHSEALALNNLSVISYDQQDYPRATDLSQQALAIATKIGDRHAEATALDALGAILQRQSNPRAAIQFHERALATARALADRTQEAQALINLANAHHALADDVTALQLLQQALPISRETGDLLAEGSALDAMGKSYFTLGNYNLAIQHHDQSLTIAKQIGNRTGQNATLVNLGNAYQGQENYARAIDYYEQALASARATADRRHESAALLNLASVYYAQSEYPKATQFYDQALAMFRATGDRWGEAAALDGIGSVQNATDDHQTAIQYHQQALTLWTQAGSPRGEAIANWNLGLTYEALGMYNEAVAAMQVMVAYEQSIAHPDADKHARLLEEVRAKAGQ